jgi:hypothetical protein
MSKILLDLNHEDFQRDLLALEMEEALAILLTLRKIRQLDWQQVYQDRGLRWEAIKSLAGPNGERTYTIRVTRRIRAVCYRDGNTIRFPAIPPQPRFRLRIIRKTV